jgi:uncharacterized membrane protein
MFVLMVLLLAMAAIGAFVVMRGQDSQIARDHAVAEAAGEVGDTANKVSEAVDQTADGIAAE